MQKEKTLVIMAAGMGSRFGGLKQIEPIDEQGNFIIDYSIYDAIKVGFNKVVFIIKKEIYDVFRNTIGKRIEKQIDVDYAFQELDKYVENVPEGRTKPWGTGHAILCAKEKVKGDFAVINADDYYGYDAFKTASQFIDNNNDKKTYALISYKTGNTLTDYGSVKRGVCFVESGEMVGIVESSIERQENGKIVATPVDGGEPFEVEFDTPVSMNLICYNDIFFDYLEKRFDVFLNNPKTDKQKSEFFIQDGMFNQIKDEGVRVKVINTNSVWYGVTYKADKPKVVEALKDMTNKGLYPRPLWK